jgi:hypothetical protein
MRLRGSKISPQGSGLSGNLSVSLRSLLPGNRYIGDLSEDFSRRPLLDINLKSQRREKTMPTTANF